MAIEFSTQSFKPREYEGEYILYTLYGLDSDGDELDDIITSPKKSTVVHTIKDLLPDYGGVYNGLHVVAILYDKNHHMLDSVVVWSNFPEDESKGTSEAAGAPSDVKDIATYLKSLNPQTAPVYNAFGSSSGTTSFPKWYSDTKKLLFPCKFYSDADMNKIIKQGNTYISKKYGEGAYELALEKVYSNAFHSNCYAVRIKPAVKEASGADEDPYTVYSLDDETGRVSKDGVYPTWRKAYAALADGTVWDEGSSNNFVFHGNHLQQIYKYKKTGRTGKWSGNGYDVIFDREISEDPADYIKAHFTPTRYNACRFNESKGANETIEYEKGHKNSRGEDAPWVIRDHKNGKVLASFSKKDDAEAHLERMKHYSKGEKLFNKQELESMAMNGYKAAVSAAWSGAGVKNFKIDIRSSEEEPPTIDVIPKTLDGKDIDVSWRILPKIFKIAQYSISPVGNHTVEREMDFRSEDDVENIFTDEFKNLDAVMDDGKPAKTETAPDDYARNNFLEDALDYAELADDNGNVTLLKFYKNKYSDDFKLASYDGENQKTLAAGGLRYVVDRYGELLDMEPAEAIIEIAKE